jgi:large subunit ribosomal protein L15
MDLHSLSNTPGARQRRKRLGRGEASGRGKTSGKGHKGQMARKGHKRKPAFEGGQMPLIRRLPKRGFKNPVRKEFLGVNLGDLDRFEDGSTVDTAVLRKVGLAKGVYDGIKILGRGDIAKKLTVKAQAFSASAKSKIEAAGGSCEVI